MPSYRDELFRQAKRLTAESQESQRREALRREAERQRESAQTVRISGLNTVLRRNLLPEWDTAVRELLLAFAELHPRVHGTTYGPKLEFYHNHRHRNDGLISSAIWELEPAIRNSGEPKTVTVTLHFKIKKRFGIEENLMPDHVIIQGTDGPMGCEASFRALTICLAQSGPSGWHRADRCW